MNAKSMDMEECVIDKKDEREREMEEEIKRNMEPPPGCLLTLHNKMSYK